MQKTVLAALAITSLLSSLAAQARFAPGDVLVCPAANRQAAVVERITTEGLEVIETDTISGVLRIRVPVGREDDWARTLDASRDVAYAERNGLGRGGLIPNDTHFGVQWHLQNTGQGSGTAGAHVRAFDAWDITTGSANTVIAVLDTGIDTDHPEFAGRIDPNGYDFVNQDPDPEADHRHGSQVSGVMCANADNNFGVAGIDWQCQVMPIKVLDQNNGGTVMDLAQGLNYVANQSHVQVISMSLINYPGSQTLINALQNARNAHKILLACAGNGGIGNANVSFPGASPLTISIGATTNTDSRANFSGTGAALDFVAPGADVITVRHGTSSNLYSTVSGCSFATPITAGIVGLVLARARGLGIPTLSQQTVYDVLQAGAIDQVGPTAEDTPGRDDFFGHGRLDARTALDAVPALQSCEYGGVGAGMGGPFDVLRINGQAVEGGQRRITVPANVPFQITMDVPPSNPQPSATPPFFIMWARLGDTTNATPWMLPLGIGELCFDPNGPATFAQIGSMAPYSTTIPALPTPFVATLQGAIFDSPQAHIAVTNVVTWDVQMAPAPVITSVSPDAAPVGATVTVNGTGFFAGLTLQLNGTSQPVLTTSANQVTFAVPAGLPCNAPLSITNPDNQSASATFNVPPTITNVVPIGGTPAAGGTRLLLIGQNFMTGTTVTIGGNSMAITSISEVLIDGTLPPGAVGAATILVTTPFGCTTTSSLTYTP